MASPTRVAASDDTNPASHVLWIGSHRIVLNEPVASVPRLVRQASSDGDSALLSQRASPRHDGVTSDDAASAVRGPPRPESSLSSSASSPGRAHSTYPDIFVPSGLVHDAGRFCFAHLDTIVLEPYDFIRLAVEHFADNPTFHYAAATGYSALLVFDSHADREAAMAHFPAKFAVVEVSLLRPEETDNRASTRYNRLIEIEAKNFLLELWHPQGANFVFGHFGVLCCVDEGCFNAGDFTVMRAFLRVEADYSIPAGCLLRLPPNHIVDVPLRKIKTWTVFEDLTAPLDGDDGDHNNGAPHIHGAWRWNYGHSGPCPGSHASHSMPLPSPCNGSPAPPLHDGPPVDDLHLDGANAAISDGGVGQGVASDVAGPLLWRCPTSSPPWLSPTPSPPLFLFLPPFRSTTSLTRQLCVGCMALRSGLLTPKSYTAAAAWPRRRTPTSLT
ncbi:uncharacterized protein [Triticum aestivum]|uniref:uncharacterized protein n=1 Tax=Triticum aestivum TaxID=4565 RepID=UPI001D0094A8|nr:uncharacterized protein LOC123160898 [Triticum aestivum]